MATSSRYTFPAVAPFCTVRRTRQRPTIPDSLLELEDDDETDELDELDDNELDEEELDERLGVLEEDDDTVCVLLLDEELLLEDDSDDELDDTVCVLPEEALLDELDDEIAA